MALFQIFQDTGTFDLRDRSACTACKLCTCIEHDCPLYTYYKQCKHYKLILVRYIHKAGKCFFALIALKENEN